MEFTIEYVFTILENIQGKRAHAKERLNTKIMDEMETGFYFGVMDTCDEILKAFEGD